MLASRPRAPVALTLVLLGGCGGGREPLEDPGWLAQEGLECERAGYPCAAADVPPDVAREGMRLAEAALERFREAHGEAVLSWLRDQPRVTHAVGDAVALRFRLEEGRPVWVLSAAALGHGSGDDATTTRVDAAEPGYQPGGDAPPPAAAPAAGRPWPPEGRPGAAAPTPPGSLPLLPLLAATPGLGVPVLVPAVPEVVGRDRDGDGRVTDRDFRRALVLDPFHWEWSRLESYRYREGTEVTRLLESTPGFEEGVVRYLRDQEAGERAFRGWEDYDVVHFSGHGHRICEYDGCFSMVFTGDTVSSEGVFDDSTLGLGRETGIMEVWDPVSGQLVRRRHVALGADWFLANYGDASLERTLVFLSGCGTADPGRNFVPDFLQPLLGPGGTMTVGWTDTVPGAPAQEAALYFYRETTEYGLRAGDVLERLGKQGLASAVNTGGRTALLRSGARDGSGFQNARLRIREVVALHEPGGGRLADGVPPASVLRGEADDDRPDTLDIDLVVEGVKPEERGRWSVDLLLNGRVVRRGIRLAEAESTGEHAYRVPLRDLPIGRDLEAGRSDTLEAVARLPEGGESRSLVRIDPERAAPCEVKVTVSGAYSGTWEWTDRENWGYTNSLGRNGYFRIGHPWGHFQVVHDGPVRPGGPSARILGITLIPPGPEDWSVGDTHGEEGSATFQVTHYTDEQVSGVFRGLVLAVPPTPDGRWYGDIPEARVEVTFDVPTEPYYCGRARPRPRRGVPPSRD